MFLLFFFSFLAGLVTILAPCIWPVLPIILATTASHKGHARPLGITLGIMVSFFILTLFLASIIKLFHFDPNFLRIFAVIVIAFLGVCLLIPAISSYLEAQVSKLSTYFPLTKRQTQSGFLPGFLIGLSLGIIWTPCAGPILATIATLAATGQVSLEVIVITALYVIGVGIPLFLFASFGQKLFAKTKGLGKYTERIQQFFGILMLLIAAAIYTNYDLVLQNALLIKFPFLNTALNGFETNSTVTKELNFLKGRQTIQVNATSLFNTDTPAPDFVGITNWLNLQPGQKPPTIANLRGKVVLVDFWTYTCINCIRTLPFVTSWYDKYSKYGFVVIGVHTPEFAFEHETSNVTAAIKMDGITYPVAQDNNYATWNNYNNEYWPAEYLIDAKGNIRRVDFGEGAYTQMEEAIQTLLAQNGKKVIMSLDTIADQTPTTQISPETYLGSARMQYFYPDGTLPNGTQNFTLSQNIPQNAFSFGGSWTITNESAIANTNAALSYHFVANKVYMILNPGNQKGMSQVKVLLDGKPISNSVAGQDDQSGIVMVTSDKLYNIVNLHGKLEDHTVTLQFLTPGIQAFTFTFG